METFWGGKLFFQRRIPMNFFSAAILIGAMLALGIAGVFIAKLLLTMMAKPLVVLIMAIAGYILVWAVIRLNSRELGEKVEVKSYALN
jgi:hypothetical protein